MRKLIGPALLIVGVVATPASAHAGHDHGASPGWTWDFWITMPLALGALLFALGAWRLHARSNTGRARLRRRAQLFAGGWLTLAGALVSPLHQAGERSFAMHMIEHELLMLLAAPLLVMAEPLSAMLWAFSPAARRRIGRASASHIIATPLRCLTGAGVATLIQAAVLWIWHMPSLFDHALAREGWHAAQHLCFFVSALLFWTAMLGRRGAGTGAIADRAVAAFCLLVMSLVTGALGALMAFASSPWYTGYARLTISPFGISPAEDQQIAGLIMWIPGGIVHLFVVLVLFRAVLTPRRTANAV